MATLSQDGLYSQTKLETGFLQYEIYEGKKIHKLEDKN
jgi:hypothetical protein